MNRKKLWFLVLSVIILVSFISGCIGGGQFGAPSTESSVTIKGVVVAPENTCFTDACANPSITEGDPLPNADIILKGSNGHTLTGKTDCAGNYQISGLTDEGYILYAHRGEVWIKKALSPVTGDGGEANYKTTAQVILWEVIENTNPGAIAINDIPTAISFDAIPQEFIDAVKAALADCRDAQQDPTCLALAKNIAVANFGAPCGCIEVTPTPTPTPGCPEGVAVAKISISDLGGFNRRFDASESIPQTGKYKITSYAWKISDEKDIIYESSLKKFDYSLPGFGNYSVSLTVTTPCEDASTSQNFQIIEKPAKLTVTKAFESGTTPDPNTKWSFTLTGPNNHSFDLPENGNLSKVLENLTPGNYTLTETQQSGFECTSIVVNGTGVININVDLANNKATFTLQSSAEVTATFTNKKQEEKPAKLTVTKAFESGTTPDPNTKWSFTLTGPNNHSFDLPENGNWSKVLENLTPGNYTLTETQQSGFECTSIVVNGTGVININVDLANNKATFTLQSSAEVTATFTNKKQEEKPAKLTVTKAFESGTTPDPNTKWSFTLTGPNNHSFDLPENGNWSKVLENLTPGNYTLTETQQSGFECTSIVVNGTGVININVDLANNKATFTLQSSAEVTATFTNKKIVLGNFQDILIVDPPTSPSAGTLGFVKIIGWGSGTYVKVQYRLLNGSLSSDLGAWCIELKSDLIFGIEYLVKFYPAVDSNPPLYDSMSNVWGIINYGKNKGYNRYAIQNEIWHITDGLNHNYIFDGANPDDSGNGIVCISVQ